jgi:hypothetical protein
LFYREFAPINHLRGLSIQPIRDFSDGRQIAFLGLFDQLGRNSAQREGIARQFNQERAVERPFTVYGADRPSMTSSISSIGLTRLLILSQNQFWNYG